MKSLSSTFRVEHPPAARPLMIFDGDCNFCRYWVERWRGRTTGRVDYAESQEVAGRFPEIPAEAFATAVQWIEPDGRVLAGAEAIFRLYDFAPDRPFWLRIWRQIPGNLALAQLGYRIVSRHRLFFSRLWGTATE